MEIIQNTPEKIVIKLDISESLANSIRRSVSEIPTLAIDEVEIYKNDSALYDEVLSHRLGLVPLKTEKSMNSKTKVEFKLSKTGPCTVYAEDLEGSADVVYGKIPLTLLGENHKLELMATAILGKGLTHAKYVPGLCYYKHILEIKSTPEIDKIIQGSKPSLLKPKKESGKWVCDINDAEINVIEKLDKEAIKDSKELLFVIESFGNMPAKEVLSKAIESLSENLDEFEKAIK